MYESWDPVFGPSVTTRLHWIAKRIYVTCWVLILIGIFKYLYTCTSKVRFVLPWLSNIWWNKTLLFQKSPILKTCIHHGEMSNVLPWLLKHWRDSGKLNFISENMRVSRNWHSSPKSNGNKHIDANSSMLILVELLRSIVFKQRPNLRICTHPKQVFLRKPSIKPRMNNLQAVC